jgi:hypothetical protein
MLLAVFRGGRGSQKELEKTFHWKSSDRIPEKITVTTKGKV